MAAIETAMADAVTNHGGVFAVIVDGVADLCHSPNDEAESLALIAKLHGYAVKFGCAIVCVLHENPGSEIGKMRGHLGSQLERKAETPLRLFKNASTGVITMWSDRCRHNHIPKDQGYCFAWSDQAGMHMSVGSASELKSAANREKMVEEADAAFGGRESIRHTDLVAAVQDALDIKERAAKGRIKKWTVAGIICKQVNGEYSLSTV